ncbi:MAG: CRISPR-associated endonuclease Cas6, partial [Melioribacteraceae bacterium]
NIANNISEIGIDSNLNEYKFQTLWMALNQNNFNKYINLVSSKEKETFLIKILIGNILSFFKNMNYTAEERIYVKLKYFEKETLFKNRQMIAFTGSFTTNALLPDLVGLGKAVSRGFGTIRKT